MEHGIIGSFAIALFVVYRIVRGGIRRARWRREEAERSRRAE